MEQFDKSTPMRALLVSCVFPPEPMTSASTSHALAQELARRGHDVTVIAPYPNRPGGRVYPGFRRRWFGCSRESGCVRVIRCFSTTSRTSSLASRLFENVTFGLSCGLAMAVLRRPDVIYLNTWPIFASGIAALVAMFRRIPMVVSVQDIYPESLVSLGRLRQESILSRLLRLVDVRIARLASDVIVISRRLERIYSSDRGIPAEKLHLIANWRRREEPSGAENTRLCRKEWRIRPGAFLFLFAGNVAAACGVEGVIETISSLPAEPPIRLVVAGSGSALEKCRNVAIRENCERTVFSGPFAAQETLPILSAADVLILPTQGDQSLVSMPSKLISYMLAARPVLAVARAESDLANIIRESGCGWVVEPGDSEQLAKRMRAAALMDRPELARMGLLGRKYALAHFSTEACLPEAIGVMEKAMGAKRRISAASKLAQANAASWEPR